MGSLWLPMLGHVYALHYTSNVFLMFLLLSHVNWSLLYTSRIVLSLRENFFSRLYRDESLQTKRNGYPTEIKH